MSFPITRMRRLRKTENIRRMVRETKLSVDNFIFPLFVQHGERKRDEIVSMPGNYRFSGKVFGNVKQTLLPWQLRTKRPR